MTPLPFMLRHKSLLPVLLLAAMSAVYVSFSLYALYSQHRTTLELAGRVHEIQRLSDLLLRTQELARPLLTHSIRGTPEATAEFNRLWRELDATLNSLTAATTVTTKEGELLAQTRIQLTAIERQARHILTHRPDQHMEQMQALERLLSDNLYTLRYRLLAWHEDELRQTDELREQAQTRLLALLIETGVLALLATVLLVWTLWYYNRILVQPLLALGRSTAILASGDLQHRVTIQSRDEIGQLATNINRMAGALYALTERLNQAAETDTLTGLLNRRAFGLIAGRELAQGNDRPCALALLDIDSFKKMNDTYGHTLGDAVLRHVAALCQQSIRQGDYCFRYGGEEFVILMPATTLDQAQAVMERARTTIADTPLEQDGQHLHVTISYGLAASPEDGSQRELLVQHADDAMYAAKEAGRNRGICYRRLPP